MDGSQIKERSKQDLRQKKKKKKKENSSRETHVAFNGKRQVQGLNLISGYTHSAQLKHRQRETTEGFCERKVSMTHTERQSMSGQTIFLPFRGVIL